MTGLNRDATAGLSINTRQRDPPRESFAEQAAMAARDALLPQEEREALWGEMLEANLREAEQGLLPQLCRNHYYGLCRRGVRCPYLHTVSDRRFDLGDIRGVVIPSPGSVYPWTDGSRSVVLDDKVESRHEPTAVELRDYAQWIGMDVAQDGPLAWISREGLQAPVLSPWRSCKTDSDEIYFFNFSNGDSSWDHPLDDHIRDLLAHEKQTTEQRRREALCMVKVFKSQYGGSFPLMLKYLISFFSAQPFAMQCPAEEISEE